MTPDAALDALKSHADPDRATGMAAYHKLPRTYLGVDNPTLNDLTKDWRGTLEVPGRITLSKALWDSNIFEARLAAAKLLTQARITPDADVWALITSWLPDLDSWAIADAAMTAGQKRLMADLSRMADIETWTTSDSHWVRRAAMVVTLPLAKLNHLKPAQAEAREQVLGWAAGYVRDPEWFIQKSVAWWLRDLSKHDPDRVRAFMAENGRHMKPFARKEAEKFLPDQPPVAKT